MQDEDLFVTYRRVDGLPIWGEYEFMTSYDELEGENCGIVEEFWKLHHRRYIPYIDPYTNKDENE